MNERKLKINTRKINDLTIFVWNWSFQSVPVLPNTWPKYLELEELKSGEYEFNEHEKIIL